MPCLRTQCPSLVLLILALVALSTVSSNSASAQPRIGANPLSIKDGRYFPEKDDSLALEDTLMRVKARLNQELGALHVDNSKYIAALYKERYDDIATQFHTRSLLTLPVAQSYLDALVAEIIRSNPDLQGIPINVYFAKTGVPNAASLGDGVILFNLGLFVQLDNESQAAFVLCHEFAHLYLKHSDQAIAKYINNLYSRETQKELHRIKSEQYNKGKDFEGLVKAFTFDNTRHSRDHESEADSLGLVFLKRTRFEPKEALTCLALLDHVDDDPFQTSTFLRETLNAQEFPFQDRWLQQDDGLLGGHAVIKRDASIEDSLKTHPDCKARILALSKAASVPGSSAHSLDPINRSRFDSLKSLFPYEIVRYYYDARNYAHCLMSGFRLLEERRADPYAVAVIGGTLNAIYEAQKNHTLGKSLPLPSPYFTEPFNTLLQFLQNLRLGDLSAINYHFLKPYQGGLSDYPEYERSWNLCQRNIAK